MTKIIFDCERMKYSNSGIYHYCLNLGREIQKNLNDKTEFLTYYAPTECVSKLQAKKIIPQNRIHKFYLPDLSDYDIWHSTFQHSDYLPTMNKKIKVVLTIHDLNFLYRESISEREKEKCLKNLQKRIDRADSIVCISDYCKKDVLKHCNVTNKSIVKIYNGGNQLSAPVVKPKISITQKPFLFSIGSLKPHKNFHIVFPIIKENPGLEFIIAGNPEDIQYVNYIKSLFREHSIETNLKLIGNITEEEKSWYYNNCEAFVFTSLSEGFGMPVIEAMSAGKPVFLSNKTSLPEIGGNAAFYFSNFSKETILNTFNFGMREYKSNIETNIQQIKSHAMNFSWEKSAKEYIKIYRQLK